MAETPFLQEPPRFDNPFRAEPRLARVLARRLPEASFERAAPELDRLGALAAGTMRDLAAAAEHDAPRHLPFDGWGRRVDRLEISPAWRELHAIAAREGVLAEAYEGRFGDGSRLVQMAKLYLFHPSSAFASCPLAMTDGAARVLALAGSAAQRDRLQPRLVSRDPATFWTSGQWMTETSGGSDVSETATSARPAAGAFLLSGLKWFSSATSAEIALALARVEGDPPGSRGLSLFLVELDGQVGRTIRIRRLKEKLGTRALPTAELELEGCRAELVGERGRGVATVAAMLNITRFHNAVCAAGSLGRCLQLARDYASRRRAFGAPLVDHPLHAETLADLAAEHAGALEIVAECAALLGREEHGTATGAESARLRLLTPIAKLLTARQAVAGASETLECFGGAGYVESTGLPGLLRDAQVLSIWEGTTNVLALDVLRACERESALEPLREDLESRIAALRGGEFAPEGAQLADALAAALSRFEAAAGDRRRREARARDFAMTLGRVVEGLALAESARHGGSIADSDLARRYVARCLASPAAERPEGEAARLARG